MNSHILCSVYFEISVFSNCKLFCTYSLKFQYTTYTYSDCMLMYIVLKSKFIVVSDILSYSMPIGHTIKKGRLSFKDTSYNGVITNRVYKGGTGILTDGKFGRDDPKEKGHEGEGWVGWYQEITTSPYIDITFEFSGVRKFKAVTLAVNVDKRRIYAAFNKSEIFFASTNDGFSDTSFLQFCPNKIPDRDAPYCDNVTLSLCENTAKFITLRLYFGGRWLLLTEISFNSGTVYIFLNFYQRTLAIKNIVSCERA